jgi:hypothetical protein
MSEQCKHCGSFNWDYGTLRDAQYFESNRGKGRKIAAVLCMTCGHVELILEDKVPFSSAAVDHPSLRGK